MAAAEFPLVMAGTIYAILKRKRAVLADVLPGVDGQHMQHRLYAGTADTAGPAMTASVQQSAVPVHTVPQTVEVACGPVRGTLLVHKTRVIHEGMQLETAKRERSLQLIAHLQ